ncbi:MAG: ABC transporter substrate-binding protein [Thermoprotei archaeon]|nr:ABC transporter substrate-binding protein [Thermoprotei archaeon]
MGGYSLLRTTLSLTLIVAMFIGLFTPITASSQTSAMFEWRLIELYDYAKDIIVPVEKDPFAERPAVLPVAIPTFTPPAKPPEPQPVTEVTIGALYPITGDLATFGKANVEALKTALEDVNKWFADNGYPWRFKLDIRDTETKPETAKSLFRTLHGAGVRYFLGPMSSGELKEVMAEIEAGLRAAVISPSSTAPGLAVKDTVYRFPPPDEFQGRVLNMLFKKDGVAHIIIVYRNDDWGKGLADFIDRYSKDFGITVAAKIPYDPKAPAFGPVVETVRGTVEGLSKTVPLDKVGVDLISFEEGVGFLVEASKVDILAKVKWYGSDGTALSAELIKNPAAAKFAAATVWKNTITFAATDIAIRIYWTVRDKLDYSPDPYSFISYDCLWIMALAIAQAGAEAEGKLPDPEKVAEKIPEIAKTYLGASGKIELNEFGDRAGSDYAIFVPIEIAAPTPTPTPAPAIPLTTIATIIIVLIVLIILAAAAYYVLRR